MALASAKQFSRIPIKKANLHLLAESAAPYVITILLAYSAADIGILAVRDLTLPDKAPPQMPPRENQIVSVNRGAMQSIISRNIFNPAGIIPEPQSAKGSKNNQTEDQAPVATQLPLGLIGTIVHSNPERSIANIEVKSKNQVIALMPNKDIENIATLLKVERNRIIIRNLNNGRKEFLENKQETKLTFSGAVPTPAKNSEIKQISPNKYKLSKATIKKHTSDLSSLLMQASTVPRRKANGEIECYILTSFQPNSIFSELGVQQGDCIKSVNGEAIDSPAKAMQLYNALQNSPTIELTYERDGRDEKKEYSIE